MEWVALLMFLSVIVVLLAGFPVTFSLGGTALLFAAVGVVAGGFNSNAHESPRSCSIRSAGCSARCAAGSAFP